jgi:predicted HTH domain antitoxin
MTKELTKEKFLELAIELFLENDNFISTDSIFSKRNERLKILTELCDCDSSELCDEILSIKKIDRAKLDQIDEQLHFKMQIKVNEYIEDKIFNFAKHAKILKFKLNFDLHDEIDEFKKSIFQRLN